MNALVPIAMFGFLPLTLALFSLTTSVRAVAACAVFGCLFLPNYQYVVSGLPAYSKASAISGSLLLATLIFDSRQLLRFRFSLADVPMIIWTLSPIPSSITNDLGLKDGVYVSLNNVFSWGIPYLLGRIHLRRWVDLRELAIGIFLGGLAYVPFCLFEMRLSPQLHKLVYGFYPFQIFDMWRLGGFRPVVFMSSGLECGMFMSAACLMGVCLWRTKSVKRLMGVQMSWLVVGLLGVTVLCRSLGALTLFLFAIGALFLCRTMRSSMPLLLLVVPVVLYIGERASDPQGGTFLLDWASMIDPARAESLRFRMLNEDLLVQKALEKPLFGWGGWGRSRVFNEEGKDVTITDSLWIIVIGMHGLVGLVSVFAAMLTPLLVMMRRVRWRYWMHPVAAGGSALAVMAGVFALDCLINAMITPVYLIGAGGVVSASLAGPRAWGATGIGASSSGRPRRPSADPGKVTP